MNSFEEAYRKVIAEGLAKWTLRAIAGTFSLSLTAFLLGYPIVSATILALALALTLLLAAYVFGWVTSYRKTRQRVDDLESRVDYHDQRQAAEDAFFEELNKKGLPRLIGDPPEDDDHAA